MKIYPVTELEFRTFAEKSNGAALAYAIGSASLAFAVGVITNAAFAEHMPPPAVVLTWVGVPVLVVGALAAFGLGLLLQRRRGEIWRQIEESIRPGSVQSS